MPGKTRCFWNRFTGAIRGKSHNSHDIDPLPPVGEDGLLAEPAEAPASLTGEVDVPNDKGAGTLTRWTRRDQTLVKLQEGYERVSQVIEEIQKHLASQGERTDRICTSLEHLARAMSDMPNVGRQQSQMLESIVGQIETGNTRMQQLVGAVEEIPTAARAQTDTLVGINRQLEMTGEQTLATAQTMEKLSSAISAVGESNATQVEVLRQMNIKTDTQGEQLGKLIARQSRRFTMLFVVTVILAAAAITTTIISLAL